MYGHLHVNICFIYACFSLGMRAFNNVNRSDYPVHAKSKIIRYRVKSMNEKDGIDHEQLTLIIK